jgi:hypothetical protein
MSSNQIPNQNGRRVIVAKGRQQTAQDYKSLDDYTTYKLFAPQYEHKLKLWQPKGKGGSWDTNYFVAFRILPALSAFTQEQIDAGQGGYADFLPGRNLAEDLVLNVGMIRTIKLVDGFGSQSAKRVTFIPRTVLEPMGYDDFPPYEGPHNNPYSLLRDRLITLGESLDPRLRLLTVSSQKRFTEVVMQHSQQNGWQVRDPRVLRPLLPAPQTNMVCYAWIYKGFDMALQADVESPMEPIGSRPGSQLNVMLMKSSVYDSLSRMYREVARVNGVVVPNELAYPDPALPESGCINYAWNIKQPHPITGDRGNPDGVGYNVAGAVQYFSTPRRPENAPVQFTPQFRDWYYDNWLPWEDALEGTTGVKQVHLIAEYFPELGPAAEIAWKDDPLLMAEWAKAPFIRDIEQVNLWNVVKRLYGNRTTGTPINTQQAPAINRQDYEQAPPSRGRLTNTVPPQQPYYPQQQQQQYYSAPPQQQQQHPYAPNQYMPQNQPVPPQQYPDYYVPPQNQGGQQPQQQDLVAFPPDDEAPFDTVPPVAPPPQAVSVLDRVKLRHAQAGAQTPQAQPPRVAPQGLPNQQSQYAPTVPYAPAEVDMEDAEFVGYDPNSAANYAV